MVVAGTVVKSWSAMHNRVATLTSEAEFDALVCGAAEGRGLGAAMRNPGWQLWPKVLVDSFVVKPAAGRVGLGRARHIEVQIFGDGEGRVVALGERDCSMQRRNQKIIEECPSPLLTPELRQRMGEASVALIKAINYFI